MMQVGLYASVAIAMVVAFTGGSPGMISAATAAVAVLVIPSFATINALAILIFMARLPQLTDVTWQAYAMVGAGLAIIYLLPRVT